MPAAQELCPHASDDKREVADAPIKQLAVMLAYRGDQLKMEQRLTRAETRIAHLEIRLSELEGKPMKGWKVKRIRQPKRRGR
jgi:hypothetical protein